MPGRGDGPRGLLSARILTGGAMMTTTQGNSDLSEVPGPDAPADELLDCLVKRRMPALSRILRASRSSGPR